MKEFAYCHAECRTYSCTRNWNLVRAKLADGELNDRTPIYSEDFSATCKEYEHETKEAA